MRDGKKTQHWCFILCVMMCMIPVGTSHARVVESTSSGGSWSDSSTWVGGVVPTTHDEVIVTGPVRITYSAHTGSTTVLSTGSLQAGGVDFFDRHLHVHGPLVNHGTITDGRLHVHAYGNVTNHAVWDSHTELLIYGNQVNQSVSITGSEVIGAFATIRNPITVVGEFTIGGRVNTGNHLITAVGEPNIALLGGVANSLRVSGRAQVIGGGQFSVMVDAPQVSLVLTSAILGYWTTVETQSIETHGYTTVGRNVTIHTDTFTNYGTLINRDVDFYTRHFTLYGDFINHGSLPESRLQTNIQGSIYNYGSWVGNRQTYLLFPQPGPHDYVQATTPNLLSAAPPITASTGRSLNLNTSVNNGEVWYLRTKTGTDPYGPTVTVNGDLDQPPIEDYFTFDLITDVDLPNQPTVSIYAQDVNFSGPVGVSALYGELYPKTVLLENGSWSGTVELFDAQTNQQLFVAGAGEYAGTRGESNTFEVSSYTGLPGKITGTVRHANGSPAGGVVVSAYSHRSSPTEVFSQADGSYSISLQPGSYSVTGSGATTNTTVGSNQVVIVDLVQPTVCSSSNIPVLLVPGIQGSDRVGHFGWFPELHTHIPTWDSGELEVHDPGPVGNALPGVVGFDAIIDRLTESEGYQMNCNLFTVPYDWSISVADVAEQYLKPWIDHAKQTSGQSQVDIVAHSMGGLVTRSYIQGDNYDNDIRKFAMVGTPNQGSVQAYFSWEGGDPILADTFGGNWFENLRNDLAQADQFQTETLARNYMIKTGKENPCIRIPQETSSLILLGTAIVYADTYQSCDNVALRNFLRSYAPSVGELFPTYSFLRDTKGHVLHPHYENKLVKALNGQTCVADCGYNFNSLEEVASSTGISVKLFVGQEKNGEGEDSLSTPALVTVTPQASSTSYYTDGTIQYVTEGVGDGTVLSTSVTGVYGNEDSVTGDSDHGTLVDFYQDQIIQFITN